MSAVHWNLAMLQRTESERVIHSCFLSYWNTHTHKVHMNNNTHSHTHPETTLKGTSCKNNASVWVLFMWISHVWLVISDTAVAYVSRIPSEYCVDDITMGKDRVLWAQLHRGAAHLQTEFTYTWTGNSCESQQTREWAELETNGHNSIYKYVMRFV